MRRPDADHLSQPWRVHDLAGDFDLLDVWRFPIRAPETVPFEVFLEFMARSQAELVSGRGPAALLFRLRGLLGRIFRWDDSDDRTRAPSPDSLRRRVADDEAGRFAASSPDMDREEVDRALPFETVYRTPDEHLAEIQNATVHALMHLGRVHEGEGWSPQMAVYVKRRGLLGRVYMALIGPFRHAIVYPAMMRAAARGWPGFLAERDARVRAERPANGAPV